MNHISENNNGCALIVVGDFNGRVSEIGMTPDHLFENTTLLPNMASLVKAVDNRGRLLYMLANNFSLNNGCIPSDYPADFTFSSSQGQSVIDTTFCSNNRLDILNKLEVLHYVTLSDHFPVHLQLSFKIFAAATTKTHQSDAGIMRKLLNMLI
ncbi:hypothetical protein JTB14_016208 [Gonioctena quinquepunctata]|nr:hypothetical protein JTB14_016208 [Gonioctena quinquepunctata]